MLCNENISVKYSPLYKHNVNSYYSVPLGQWSIAISVFVCLSVHDHVSTTAGPIFTKFVVQIPCGRGSVLLWRRCDTLCTSSFMDDVTFGN